MHDNDFETVKPVDVTFDGMTLDDPTHAGTSAGASGSDSASTRVLDVEQVVALEQELAASGTSLHELMKRAGAAAAEVALAMLPEDKGAKAVIFAGSGNNGGDGWVVAELLAARGCVVAVVAKCAATDITAQPAHDAAAEAASTNTFRVLIDPAEADLNALLADADIVVDAVLGTGFAHDSLRAPYDAWTGAINAEGERGVPVLAVDCPSGLNAQTGAPVSGCVKADITVTMLAVKTGLLQSQAAPFVGRLYVAPLV